MQNEHTTWKVASFRQFLIGASLVYLLLPNLLFLLGWVRSYVALPLAVLLVGAVYWVCRKNKEEQYGRQNAETFSVTDGILLCLILAVLYVVTDLVGFHANTIQDPDFTYRNAIYATLVCEDWPIYSPRGEYFIYYHAFWLPPALLTKLCGGFLSPHTALFWWSYIGLALAGCLFYTTLRKSTVFFGAILLGTFSLSYTASVLASLYDPNHEMVVLHGQNLFYLTNFCFNQLRCTFNHAIPGLLFMALVLCKGVPIRYLALPSALLFCLSPMAAVAIIPLLGLIIYGEWREHKQLPFNATTIICVAFIVPVLLYLSSQNSSESASMRFLWNDSPFWAQKSVHYADASYRITHAVGLCASFLLPLILLLDRKLRSTLTFKALVITVILISIVWIGRTNNELLFKGSLILAVLQAFLFIKQWETAAWPRKWAIILFFGFSCISFSSGYVRAQLYTHRWSHHGNEGNLINGWDWSLNHPENNLYMNFFGNNRAPWLLYSKEGDSRLFLPISPCEKTIFTIE